MCVRYLVCLFAILMAAQPSASRDIFVNNVVGNDTANGLAAESSPLGGPVRSICRGMCLAGPGDRVVLAATDQPYHEMIALSGWRHRGSPQQPFVIDGGGAILDGTVRAADGAWRYDHDEVFAMRPRRLAYQQLFLDGRPLEHVQVASWSPAVPQLEPLQWTLLRGHIYFRVEHDRLPQSYALRHAGLQTGVTLYNTQHVRIENLIVQGFQQDGINAHDTVRDCQLVHVECRANGRSGISIGGASRVEVRTAVCYDNGRAQLRVEGLARVALWECDLDNKSAPPLDIRGGRVIVDGEER